MVNPKAHLCVLYKKICKSISEEFIDYSLIRQKTLILRKLFDSAMQLSDQSLINLEIKKFTRLARQLENALPYVPPFDPRGTAFGRDVQPLNTDDPIQYKKHLMTLQEYMQPELSASDINAIVEDFISNKSKLNK